MNNLFLLGAGFDKALVSKAPLNNELLSELVRFSNGKHKIDNLESRYRTSNVEQIITYLDLEILSGNEEAKTTRVNIDNLIASYFQNFRFTEELLKNQDWIKEFITETISKNDAIVSLNYSCLIDSLLDYFGVWTPCGGYTKIVENWIPTTNADHPKNPNGILLYKIHGSEHFQLSGLLNGTETYIAPIIEPSIFPKSFPHSHFGGGLPELGQYIIAPSFIKVPHVQIAYLMNEAIKRAGEVRNFIITGCGMRPEDTVLWLMLTNFLKTNYKSPENKNRKLIIVDPQAKAVGERIKNHFSNLIGGFFETENFILISEKLKSATSKIKSLIES